MRLPLFLVVLDSELYGVKQNSVQNIWKLILTNVPTGSVTVDSYINGLFDGSSYVVL